MYSRTDEEFFRDDVASAPYREDSTAHPSMTEFTDRFSHRTAFPLIAVAEPAPLDNPYTMLDVLYVKKMLQS